MFSANELLHFVFADGNDSYFCSELLVLDLHQALWLRLHEQGYGCVYFLELSDRSVCLRGYSDKLAQGYTPDRGRPRFFKQRVRSSGLQKWMLKTLREKEPARSAIVCDLGEFCAYFGADEWKDFLAELADLSKRNGILVLTAPPEAEASRSVLLNSPVFERLRERGVTELRNASLCDMYAAIHRSKPDSMVYLNTYTRDRIHNLLTRMMMEDPKRTLDAELLPEMEDLLLQWMNNPELRERENQIARSMPKPNSPFRMTYGCLRREEAWSQFAAKAEQISKAGGIRRYLASLGCSPEEDPVSALGVRRDPDSFAGQCMRLRVRSVGGKEEQAEINRLLTEIRGQVVAPRNREDNPRLAEAVNKLIPEFRAADDDRDFGTIRRILFSINFCIQKLSVPGGSSEESAILTVLEKLQDYVQCSSIFHDRQRSLSRARSEQLAGRSKLAVYAMRQLEEQTETARRMLNAYEDVIQASVVQISLASGEAVSNLAERLSETLSRQNEALARQPAEDRTSPVRSREPAVRETQAPPAAADEEAYVLSEEDFNF